MSRRSTATPLAFGAMLLIAVALAGCATTTTSSSPTKSPAPSASAAAPSEAPEPAPTPTFVARDYTCDSILPPATLAVFKEKKSDGFTLQADFVSRVRNFDSNLALFDTYGGILCQWAYPGATNTVDYGYSKISDDQAATEQAALAQNGYVATQEDNGTLLANSDAVTFPDNYLFVDGHWMYASSRDLLDTIVSNVFSTGEE
jgi:hypothetical protein